MTKARSRPPVSRKPAPSPSPVPSLPERADSAPKLLDAALTYAAAGWPVFPCVPTMKTPLTNHGFKDATTDPRQITGWWARHPRANVAVATGAPGPDVLDVDTKDGRGGMDLFSRACRAGLVRGATALVRTPSGGLHVWFTGTDQRGGAVGLNKALELKARGGYVLLPPSYVEDATYDYAGHYEVIEYREEAGATIDFGAIRRLLEPPRPSKRLPSPAATLNGHGALVAYVARAKHGKRNDALYWAAWKALETGADEAVMDQLLDAALGIGLTEWESRRTIASARNHPPGGFA